MENQEIREWIRGRLPELVETLKEICRIRSVADLKAECKPYGEGCKRVLKEMLRIGREAGFETVNYEDYVGCISYPGRSRKSIGIWAHLDVVDEGEDWDYPPYEPTVKDGYFIARGSQDNKSSAAMGLYVLKYMKEHGIVLNHTLELYLGTCEEIGMHDLDYFTAHYECPALSLVPDSGFPVCCGERGSFNGELTLREALSGELLDIKCDCGQYTVPDRAQALIRYTPQRWERCQSLPEGMEAAWEGETIRLQACGVSTQAANPDKGISALTRLAELICGEELLPEPDRKVFGMVRDINHGHDGRALSVYYEDDLSGPVNLVATQLNMQEGEEGKRPVIGFISKFPVTGNDFPYIQRAEAAAAERGFTLKVTRFSKANYFDPQRRAVKYLTQCSNEVLGRADAPFIMSGGTYARKLPNAFAFGTGMPQPKPPAGMFRPGHGDYHQPDESISLERMEKALQIYIQGILAIDELEL